MHQRALSMAGAVRRGCAGDDKMQMPGCGRTQRRVLGEHGPAHVLIIIITERCWRARGGGDFAAALFDNWSCTSPPQVDPDRQASQPCRARLHHLWQSCLMPAAPMQRHATAARRTGCMGRTPPAMRAMRAWAVQRWPCRTIRLGTKQDRTYPAAGRQRRA